MITDEAIEGVLRQQGYDDVQALARRQIDAVAARLRNDRYPTTESLYQDLYNAGSFYVPENTPAEVIQLFWDAAGYSGEPWAAEMSNNADTSHLLEVYSADGEPAGIKGL